ncbi:MAG: CarD family transcriptional regulator [Alphaproteobacteria bacterium]|nr:CarD family transcriptional regulator [Alphaproteobacteria bacterium]
MATKAKPKPKATPKVKPTKAKPKAKAKTKTKAKKLPYAVKDYVVYPTHGVGQVTDVVTEEVAGFELQLYVILFAAEKMTLRVPVGKAQESGLRKISSKDKMQTAVGTLKGRARAKRTMWSRRAQEYDAKINSGDPIQIAEVVRDLHRPPDQPDQSYSERQMYEAAISRLALELSLVEKIDLDAATAKLETMLIKTAPPPAAAETPATPES